MLKVNLKVKDKLELSAKEKGYIYEKVESLEELFGDRHDANANVLCSMKGNTYTVEVTIPTKHIVLRAETKGDSVYSAIDITVDKVERQFLRHKKRINTLIKKRDGVAEYYAGHAEEPAEKEVSQLVKTKQVSADVMTVDEAILQLEMLDHDFFLFINEENHKPTLVYLRKDGNYGTIEMK